MNYKMNLAPALLVCPMDKNDAPISNYHQTSLKQKRLLSQVVSDPSPHHDIIFSGPNSVSADAFLELPVARDSGLQFEKLNLSKQNKSCTFAH
jgi:hypothetical protein